MQYVRVRVLKCAEQTYLARSSERIHQFQRRLKIHFSQNGVRFRLRRTRIKNFNKSINETLSRADIQSSACAPPLQTYVYAAAAAACACMRECVHPFDMVKYSICAHIIYFAIKTSERKKERKENEMKTMIARLTDRPPQQTATESTNRAVNRVRKCEFAGNTESLAHLGKL